MRDWLPVLALLAGGLATRLGLLTAATPKSLVMVDGESFLAHQLRLLVSQGLSEIVICCGHFGEQIEDFAGDGSRFGCSIRYSYDGNPLLGTGGALRRALPLLGERFLVMYGDSYLTASYARIWNEFLVSKKPALMSVLNNEDRWDKSNVELSAGRILRYGKRQRTAAMRHIDYGLSALHASVLQGEADTFDLACVFERLAMEGQLAACEVQERFYEIGSLEGLRETEQKLKQLRMAGAMAGCEL